jgi:hypothetical protein
LIIYFCFELKKYINNLNQFIFQLFRQEDWALLSAIVLVQQPHNLPLAHTGAASGSSSTATTTMGPTAMKEIGELNNMLLSALPPNVVALCQHHLLGRLMR